MSLKCLGLLSLARWLLSINGCLIRGKGVKFANIKSESPIFFIVCISACDVYICQDTNFPRCSE